MVGLFGLCFDSSCARFVISSWWWRGRIFDNMAPHDDILSFFHCAAPFNSPSYYSLQCPGDQKYVCIRTLNQFDGIKSEMTWCAQRGPFPEASAFQRDCCRVQLRSFGACHRMRIACNWAEALAWGNGMGYLAGERRSHCSLKFSEVLYLVASL